MCVYIVLVCLATAVGSPLNRGSPCSRQRCVSSSVRKRKSSDDLRSTRERRPGSSGEQWVSSGWLGGGH